MIFWRSAKATERKTGRLRIGVLLNAALEALIVLALSFLAAFGNNAFADEKWKGPLPILRFKVVGEITGGLEMPSDAAVDDNGKIYVLDGTNNIVRVYDRDRNKLNILGGDGFLSQPVGLTVSAKGEVFVADSRNARIAVFQPDSTEPAYIDLPETFDGFLADPVDVALDPTESVLYVVDNDSHRIIALEKSGKILWTVGKMGRLEGQFRFPYFIAVAQDGDIHVVESVNTQVQVLKPDGKFDQYIGGWGIMPGEFFRPKGIAIDDKGRVFVSDSYVGVIQAFDQEGNFLAAVGDENGELRRFNNPVGITTWKNYLYVVEMIGNRVLMLQAQ